MTLSDYARRISSEVDVILAPEYKIMQALRFTLDVRQPFKGLKGVLMELLNLANGMVGEVEGVETRGASALQHEMLALDMPPKIARTPWKAPVEDMSIASLTDRINAAYFAARTLLDKPALLTDVYFLYTPSQLMLASLHIADEPLTTFYLTTKLPLTLPIRPKILATIHTCADILATFSDAEIMTKDQRAALEDKLDFCRDPGTRDLVKAHAAAKRGSDSDQEEKAAKKKIAREKHAKEGEDLFGPNLGGGA